MERILIFRHAFQRTKTSKSKRITLTLLLSFLTSQGHFCLRKFNYAVFADHIMQSTKGAESIRAIGICLLQFSCPNTLSLVIPIFEITLDSLCAHFAFSQIHSFDSQSDIFQQVERIPTLSVHVFQRTKTTKFKSCCLFLNSYIFPTSIRHFPSRI